MAVDIKIFDAQSFYFIISHPQGVIIVLQTYLTIRRLGLGNHVTKDSAGTDVHKFFNECNHLSMHVIRKTPLNQDNCNRPTQQISSSY